VPEAPARAPPAEDLGGDRDPTGDRPGLIGTFGPVRPQLPEET